MNFSKSQLCSIAIICAKFDFDCDKNYHACSGLPQQALFYFKLLAPRLMGLGNSMCKKRLSRHECLFMIRVILSCILEYSKLFVVVKDKGNVICSTLVYMSLVLTSIVSLSHVFGQWVVSCSAFNSSYQSLQIPVFIVHLGLYRTKIIYFTYKTQRSRMKYGFVLVFFMQK